LDSNINNYEISNGEFQLQLDFVSEGGGEEKSVGMDFRHEAQSVQ
jgi:hypothetical protein